MALIKDLSQKLQLVCVAAMLITSKFDKIRAPKMDSVLSNISHTSNMRENLAMQASELRCLHFDLTMLFSITFMLWVLITCYALNKSSRAHDVLSQSLVELALWDRYKLRLWPSMASAATCLVLGKLCCLEFEWGSTLTTKPESHTVQMFSLCGPALCRFFDIETSLHSLSRLTAAMLRFSTSAFFQIFIPVQNLLRKVSLSSAIFVSPWSNWGWQGWW